MIIVAGSGRQQRHGSARPSPVGAGLDACVEAPSERAPAPAASAFAEAVLAVVAASRPGEVMTYGEVAREAGRPGAARAVGTVLREHGATSPWWRVVTVDGRLVPGSETEHARLLGAEGIGVVAGRVRVVDRP